MKINTGKIRRPVILLAWAACCLTACEKKAAVAPEIVAAVGDRQITFRELEESFILDPRYAVRTPLRTARESQLQYLVEQEYYFRAALAAGLPQDSAILAKINYIEQQEVLKAFIREQFLDTVRIDPDAVIEGLQRFSHLLQVWNIFRRDQDEIRRILTRLREYPAAAADIFQTLGTDLGWITFGMIDPVLEQAAYGLSAGEYSAVIATAGGFHLLFVAAVRINPDYQQVTQNMRMSQVTDALRKRSAHSGILAFLKQRAGSDRIQINNRVAARVAAVIDSGTERGPGDPAILQPPISRDELELIDMDLLILAGEPIARFGNIEMTVGGFLQRLKEMPPYHRPYIRGPARLVQVLLDMLRNDMLLAAASEQGYPLRAGVRTEIDRYTRELLAGEFGRHYNNDEFRQAGPEEWARFDQALRAMRDAVPAAIHRDHLFADGQDPDSVLTEAPIPVFLKSRYLW